MAEIQSLHSPAGAVSIHSQSSWLQEPRLGGIFTFVLYNDRQGFGAQAIREGEMVEFGHMFWVDHTMLGPHESK